MVRDSSFDAAEREGETAAQDLPKLDGRGPAASERCPWCDGSGKPAFDDQDFSAGNALSPAHHGIHGSDYY